MEENKLSIKLDDVVNEYKGIVANLTHEAVMLKAQVRTLLEELNKKNDELAKSQEQAVKAAKIAEKAIEVADKDIPKNVLNDNPPKGEKHKSK